MFPRIKDKLLARADLLVELTTLGEYGLDESGRPMALEGYDCGDSSNQPPLRQRNRCAEPVGATMCLTGRSRALPARP
jgi:hypothetical protein